MAGGRNLVLILSLGLFVGLSAPALAGGTEACCFGNGTCQDEFPGNCVDLGGFPMGPGTVCLGDGNTNGTDDACEAVGGCCLSDGSCLNADYPDCVDKQSGVYYGPGSACAGDSNGNGQDDLCEPTRACCHPDGSCSNIPAEECVGKFGGEPQALGADCIGDLNVNGIDDICEDVQGCCLPNGTCVNVDVPTCLSQGGDPQGEGYFCTVAEACCLPSGVCANLDPLCCVAQLGTPLGDGTVCAAPQACCLPGGACQNLDTQCCLLEGGTSQGPGTACAGDGNSNGTDDACELANPEACCLPNGSCVVLLPALCAAQGGVSQGPGSVCTAPQACCLPDGTCADLDPLCCQSAGGTPLGGGSSCGPNEACCFPNETCRIRTAACCALQGGIPQGSNSVCEPPTITCPGDVSVECDQPVDPGSTGTPTAGDDCDGTLTIGFTENIIPGNCPQERTIVRTWTATDADGNTVSCDQTITVVDNTPPVITCPGDVTVECTASTDPSATGSASAIDNCDLSVDVIHSDSITPGSCPQERIIQRTWTATDDCGNSAPCVQTITVDDSTLPTITCPVDVTVACDESTDPSNTGSAGAVDNCDNDLSPGFVDSETPGSCPQEKVIARTWSVADDCGNPAQCVQTITVVDDEPPVLTCPAPVVVTCPGPNGVNVGDVLVNATAIDNCDLTPTITDDRPGVIYPPTCGNLVTVVTFNAVDDCGNAAMSCQTTVDVIGAECCSPQACCLPNGSCVSILPSACLAQGGVPQGVGATCTAPRACCLPGGSCSVLDPLCCLEQGGSPSQFTTCEGDSDGDGVDQRCGDACPEDPNKINPGPCPCGVPNVDSDGDGVLDCDDVCPGQDDTIDDDNNGIPDCANDQPIPTVSEWGMIVLALLLLVGGKVYFGRRVAEA